MANNKPNAIVLGGTNDHIALLRNLKGRGYHTTLIDYYDNPCAKPYADNFIQESTLNKEKVLEIAKNLEADLVISSCIDQALLTACYVAEKLNLPAPFDYQTALNVTNKRYMKEIFVKNDIPTSKHIVYDDNFDIGKSGLKFPLMVKPADSNGSYGVKKVNSIEKLDSYINYAKSISRTSNVVIEEFIDGLEISVDCFVKDKKAYVLLMSQLNKYNVGEDTMLIYQTITPPRISESIKEKISDTANKIVKAFNLDNTPLLIQLIANEENVNVIEFSPRIGGGSKYKTIATVTGFDIMNSSVNSFLGIKTDLEYNINPEYYSGNFIYAKPGILGEVKNVEKLIDEKIIDEFIFYKTKGAVVGEELASRNRVASFFVKADTIDKLYEKIDIAVENLEVYDINGNAIMRKDISGKRV